MLLLLDPPVLWSSRVKLNGKIPCSSNVYAFADLLTCEGMRGTALKEHLKKRLKKLMLTLSSKFVLFFLLFFFCVVVDNLFLFRSLIRTRKKLNRSSLKSTRLLEQKTCSCTSGIEIRMYISIHVVKLELFILLMVARIRRLGDWEI